MIVPLLDAAIVLVLYALGVALVLCLATGALLRVQKLTAVCWRPSQWLLAWNSQPPSQRFFVGWLIAFSFALIWPVALWLTIGDADHSLRWIQNDLPFSIGHVCIFPVTIGLFCATLARRDFAHMRRRDQAWAWFALVVYVVLGLWFFCQDTATRPIDPYMVKNADQALGCERDLRKAADNPNWLTAALRPLCPHLSAKRQKYDSWILADRSRHSTPLIQGLMEVFPLYNRLGYIAFLENIFFGLFLVVFIWYVTVVLGLTKDPLDGSSTKKLLLIYVLLLLWIPLRAYASFYQSRLLAEPEGHSPQHGLGIVAALAISVSVILIFLKRLRRLAIALSASQGALIALVGLVVAADVRVIAVARGLTQYWERMHFVHFVIIAFVSGVAIYVIGLQVARESDV